MTDRIAGNEFASTQAMPCLIRKMRA